jgi:hypothetical protein
MRPYLITATLMRPSNMKRFPTPALTDSNQIWCSDYSEHGDKHITRILSLYLESRATPGISASAV